MKNKIFARNNENEKKVASWRRCAIIKLKK